MDLSTRQASYEVLRRVLLAAVHSGAFAGDGIEVIPLRAVAALYSLLVDHAMDRGGRCRSCRRPSGLLGLPRRHCQVRGAADLWLRLPVNLLESFLASALELSLKPRDLQPVPEVESLAELLAEVVMLAGQPAAFSSHLEEIAERAQQYPSVRRALQDQDQQ